MRKQKLPLGAINYSSCSFVVSFALDWAFTRGEKREDSEGERRRGLIVQFCQLQMGERESTADLRSSLPPYLLNTGPGPCSVLPLRLVFRNNAIPCLATTV